MEENRARFVAFADEEATNHYGLLLADGETIVCACCGGTFQAGEDATITQSCEWYGTYLKDFLEEAVLGL